MIIKSNLVPAGFDAITCWPLILVRPAAADDASLIIHEMVHYREQRNSGVVPWLLLYWLSKRFRLGAEVRGYQAQIAAGGISRESAANYLVRYGLGVSYEEALQYLA